MTGPASAAPFPSAMDSAMTRTHMQARRILIGIGALLVGAAWYAFRPDRLFVDRTVDEPLLAPDAGDRQAELVGRGLVPAPSYAVVECGRFHGAAHETVGQATVYDVGTGRRLLRLTSFRTSNGPDVHVYLVAAPSVTDDVVKHAPVIDLGLMKGNRGNQNYALPAGTDLSKYQSVSIWCERFGVNFGSAHLGAS
jgi:hypothetical protein